MGAPGSGKGTQAEKLMNEYDCHQISTGVLLRQSIESGSDLGHKVQKIMSEGLLVSDDIVLDLIKKSTIRDWRRWFSFGWVSKKYKSGKVFKRFA